MRRLISKYYIVYSLLYLLMGLVIFPSFILAIPYLLLSDENPIEMMKDTWNDFMSYIKYSHWKSYHKGQL